MSAGLVFITGASSGIGQALAARYARAGWRLALVARRTDVVRDWARAQGLADEHCWVVAADVQQVVQAARGRGLPLRVLAIGAAQPVAGADAHLAVADGRVRLRYGVGGDGAAYLLRPDQHVCARWLQLGADRLQAALAAALPA